MRGTAAPELPAAEAAHRAFRDHFPVLERTVHLASCSLGARSIDLDRALAVMLDDMASLGAPWGRFEEQVAEARGQFAALIGAAVEQVAVVPNATVGAYQVASGLDWSRRGRVVTDRADFPSVAHVWLAQRAAGADVRFAGSVDEQLSLIDDRVALVSVPLVDYADGRRRPVRRVADAAHEAGARVFVDAYQAVGVEPVDVTQLDCDFLVAGCMKYLLGLPGLAFLYARSPADADRAPVLTGWFGRVDPFAFDAHRLDFPAAARRFETGTPAIPACYASSAGLRLVGGLDLRAVRDHVLRLTTLAVSLLTAHGEAVRAAAPDERGAHIGLVDPEPARLATWLAGRRIVTSPRGDVLRLSFHYYNDARDVEALCDAVAEYRSESDPTPVVRSTNPR